MAQQHLRREAPRVLLSHSPRPVADSNTKTTRIKSYYDINVTTQPRVSQAVPSIYALKLLTLLGSLIHGYQSKDIINVLAENMRILHI